MFVLRRCLVLLFMPGIEQAKTSTPDKKLQISRACMKKATKGSICALPRGVLCVESGE